MRTRWVAAVALATTVIVTTLGAWGGVGGAQEVADSMAPAYFSLTRGAASESVDGVVQDTDGDGLPELRGQVEVDVPVEASDARASGLWTFTVNADLVGAGGGVVGVDTRSNRLVNDDGAWTGTGTAISAFGEDGDFVAGLTVLTGEGAYEGLSLIISQSFEDGVESYWGVIFPSSKMPPMPDPVGATGG